jgi:hypothetical protein
MMVTVNELSTGNWMFVVGEDADLDEDAVRSLANEAHAAAPPAVLDGGSLLPRRRPPDAICRICGSADRISREHIPPRAAGNSGTHREHSITEWLTRDSLDEIPGGRTAQGGNFGFVLCVDCNSRTGRLATEYRKWAAMGARLFVEQLRPVDEMDRAEITPLVTISVPGCHPAKFARQALSMMVSLAGPWPITAQFPELAATLLDGTPCELPAPLWLGMGLCAPVAARYAGPSLAIDSERGTWRWFSSLAYPPFAFELELARSSGDDETNPLCGIGNFLEHPDSTTAHAELDLIVGFAHTAFPGDWRTRAQIEAGLDLYGRAATR